MSKKQPESIEIFVRYRIDSSSEQTAKKLDIKQFREAITKEAEALFSHKEKIARGR